jgi:hypothetical protein
LKTSSDGSKNQRIRQDDNLTQTGVKNREVFAMKDSYRAWPHAEIADIYTMFPPEGASSELVFAGSYALEAMDSLGDPGPVRGSMDFNKPRTCCCFGIDMEMHNGDAAFVNRHGIYKIPTFIKAALNHAFPGQSALLDRRIRIEDIEWATPSMGPILEDALKHPYLRGLFGFCSKEEWIELKVKTLSTALMSVGAPTPSPEANLRISEWIERETPDFQGVVDHNLSWMKGRIEEIRDPLSSATGRELDEYGVLSLVSFSDEKADGKKVAGSIQKRLRFLGHFPGAWRLFTPYEYLGDDLKNLRRAIDDHQGNLQDHLTGLVDQVLQDSAAFRKNPSTYLDVKIETEKSLVLQKHRREELERAEREEKKIQEILDSSIR